MQTNQQSSILMKVTSFLFFIALLIATVTWFLWGVFHLIDQIRNISEIIIFEKGVFYFLGASLILLTLILTGIYEGILHKQLTKKITKKIMISFCIGFVLMLSLPQITHYLLNSYLEYEKYSVCEEASSQWFFYQEIIYTSNLVLCESADQSDS